MSKTKKFFVGVGLVLAAIGLLVVVSSVWEFMGNSVPAGPVYKNQRSGAGGYGISNFASPSAAPMGGQGVYSDSGESVKTNDSVKTYGEISDRKVVRNGYLDLLVQNSEETSQKIQTLAADMGGFVQEAKIYEVDENTKNGTVTIKVPADNFEEAMAAIKEFGLKVQSENSTAQDVTEQYIDLEAQLKNYQLEEQQYQDVLKKAQKVDDILQVHAQLARVRGDIERIQGQLKYLSRQVDMSSISVSLTAESEVTVLGIRWRPLYEMKLALRSMLESLTSFVDMVISLVIYLPVIILWVLLLGFVSWLGRKIWLWIKSKFFSV